MKPFGYPMEIIKIETISSHSIKGEDHKLDLNGAYVWLLFMWSIILVKFLTRRFTLD
jgi:hypothetical protein